LSRLALLRTLGPGMLLAATSVGGSHLVLAPTAGARFGYDLLWLVLVAHLFKYHAFEFGPRFAVGAGRSLLSGYGDLPGPKNWAVWIGLIDIILESVGIIAAVGGLCGAVLYAAFPIMAIPAWTLVVLLAVITMLALGRYTLMTRASMAMLALLTLGSIVAFLAKAPSVAELSHIVRPSLPIGSLFLASAVLGWMPTGVGVSVWHSLWIREDPRFSGDQSNIHQRFTNAMRDMRIGYILSALLAVIFLSLGASVLHPRGIVPHGVDTALTLASLYTEILGAWMQPVFLLIAFFAMFSTTYTVMEAMPRTLLVAARQLRNDPNSERMQADRPYWILMLAMTAVSLVIVGAVADPVALITILGAVTFVFSPVYCVANYFCVTRLIEDERFRPGKIARAVAMAGIVFMTGATGLFVYTEIILKVFGAQ
jgi:Mn2+/Fe2+ NRAMP family transporter